MNTQISRSIFDPDKRYSGVYQQMGRMLVDSDWNAMSDIGKHRLAQALSDIIGTGTPRARGIVESTEQPDGSFIHLLRWGHVYIDGESGQVRPDPAAVLDDPNAEALELLHQADFPAASEPAGDHRLYVDLWERTVNVLEDAELRDAGLQGADTCTRTQTMAQVKWCALDFDPEDLEHNPPIGEGLLGLTLRAGSTEPDPCDPCAEEIALQDKLGNYLFRLEIHTVEYNSDREPVALVLKWSSENGAEQYEIGAAPPGFESGFWCYEFHSGAGQAFASEKHLGVHAATGFTPTRGEILAGYPDSPPPGFDLVRRWDGYCRLEKSGGDWTLLTGSDRGTELSSGLGSDAHGHFSGGAVVTINMDVMTAEISLNDSAHVAGDYWQVDVRQAINVVGDQLLVDEPPQGIEHHYMTLGDVVGGAFVLYDAPDCKRFEFPPLTDIRAEDVCYDNLACNMPGVENVKQALDHLCGRTDLEWHHKHLHGWGIVCGLIAECCPEHLEEALPDDGESYDPSRNVCVTPGAALTCEGEALRLESPVRVPVMDEILALQESGTQILSEDGMGSVCLRLDRGPDAAPMVSVEAYDPSNQGSMFDGTLLMDFYNDCILGLVEDLREEFDFLDLDDLEDDEGGATGLVSDRRRIVVSLLNLVIQLFNSEDGSYVFLSRKEHDILERFYNRLRGFLRSKTFCAMFNDFEFPAYPFDESGRDTVFGKNSHTRILLHPSGTRIYSYGGTDNTINIYSVESGELERVVRMPSAEGAAVSALAFSPDGSTLWAAASIRGADSIFGRCRVKDNHAWEEMTVLCDILVAEMHVSRQDPGLIFATGLGRGLYYIRPQVLFNETAAKPTLAYAFNAAGHMAIDAGESAAYCTANSKEAEDYDRYSEIVVCNLGAAPEEATPGIRLPLRLGGEITVSGTDGLALRDDPSGQRGHLYITVEDPNGGKHLLTYALALSAQSNPQNELAVDNTTIALAWHPQLDAVLLGMEDGYRLQVVNNSGSTMVGYRTPVQVQPVDVIVDGESGQIYALNYISNTLSVVPMREVPSTDAFLDTLSTYRTDILEAFFALFGGVLQYLKDCFCHHLLIKCPPCDDDNVIYLGVVEIRDNEVYKICNFDKRKYVKSFPTMGYWFSLIPIWPMLTSVVKQVCCAVIPNIFDGFRDDVIKQPAPATGNVAVSGTRYLQASQVRQYNQAYRRTDVKATLREQTRGAQIATRLGGDTAINYVNRNQTTQPGVGKQVLVQSRTQDAVAELERNNITVTAVEEYDERKAGQYLADYTRTPQRIERGSEVTVVQKKGKVMYYAAKLPTDTQARDTAATVAVTDEMRTEVAILQRQVETIRAEREAEEGRLAEIGNQRAAMAAEIDNLRVSMTQLDTMRRDLNTEVTRIRPVMDIEEVDSDTDVSLREAGIRTVGELSEADPVLLERNGVGRDRAALIIEAARGRLNRDS